MEEECVETSEAEEECTTTMKKGNKRTEIEDMKPTQRQQLRNKLVAKIEKLNKVIARIDNQPKVAQDSGN